MTTRSYNENGSDMAAVQHGYYNSNIDHNNISNSLDPSEASDQADQPRYLTHLDRGRAANFFVNGDVFFPAKKVVYNPRHFRDFTHYLDYLTDKLEPRFGAVRKICTPHHGHRIRELRDLQENGLYVVAGKERFKPYQYDQIAAYEKKRAQPVNYNTDPMYPSRQYVTSGRIKKCEVQSILIKVWPNGGDLKGPRRVLLTPRVRPFTLPNVMSHVNELLKEDLLGTVDRLHYLNGVQVSDVEQITHNGQYVACRRTEKFKRVRYNEQGTKNLSTSPRLERKLLAPLHLRGSNGFSQSSPEQSNTSTQSSVTSNSHRRRVPRGDEQVFLVKPSKHSRSSDRSHTFDPDKDQSGTFKPRQNNHYTQDPRLVQDHPSTGQRDLPDHHWEPKPTYRVGGYRPPKNQRADKPPQPSIPPQKKLFSTGNRLEDEDSAATKIQAAYRGHQSRKELISPKPPTTPKEIRSFPSGDRLEEEDNAATKIQAAYRAHRTRKELKSTTPSKSIVPEQIKQQSPGSRLEDEDKAASKIQAAYRGHQTRRELKSPKQREVPRKKKLYSSGGKLEEDKAASKIQAAYRGHQARKTLGGNEAQFEKSRDLNEQNRAAAKIQAGYRGYQQRKSTTSKTTPQEDEAAAKIQAGYRGYQTRKQLSLRQKMLKEKAASKIQAGVRGYKTRKRVAEKHTAATKIQSSYRGHLTRKNLDIPQKVTSPDRKDKARGEEDKAATKIQAGYRGYMSRKQISNRRPPPAREDSYDGLARENQAATTIQSHYRGYRTRQDLAGHRATAN